MTESTANNLIDLNNLSMVIKTIKTDYTNKINIPNKNFTLIPEFWKQEENSLFFMYELISEGITSNIRADIVFNIASLPYTKDILPVSETRENKIILRAKQIPTQSLTGVIYLMKGEN